MRVGPTVTHLENLDSLTHSFRYYVCGDPGSQRRDHFHWECSRCPIQPYPSENPLKSINHGGDLIRFESEKFPLDSAHLSF